MGTIGMFSWFKHRRRKRITAQPFPDEWKLIIDARLPYVATLPHALRDELFGLTQIFLAEKHFEGCGGFEVTDEVRVIIACQACVLLLNRPTDLYPKLRTVLIYESAFYVENEERKENGLISLSTQVRAGESWNIGVVILAWEEILHGLRHKHDGYNVIIHEFAHQLDQENRHVDGVPVLDHSDHFVQWQEVFSEHYAQLLEDIQRNRKTVLDDYGATNPAEFFAVASESFFEESIKLQDKHPDLYDVLMQYYKQDPARFWREGRQ